MNVAPSTHPWSEEALFSKALIYVERMESYTANDWQLGFWSALSLELLARATLAHISPILLAENKNWRNLTYALGQEPTAKKSPPISIGAHEVFVRLSELLPSFTEEMEDFCAQHARRRNSELHTGELAFAVLRTSQWLSRVYAACKILLECMEKDLGDLFSDPESAQAMIESLEDEAAKAVARVIRAHAEVWSSKNETERGKSLAEARAWATRHAGHRVDCPACKSPALVQGNPSGAVTTAVEEDTVKQRQTMLPSSFECIACGLRISGLSKLSACGLGDAFTATSAYSAADFFGLHTEDELDAARNEMPEFEEDFND